MRKEERLWDKPAAFFLPFSYLCYSLENAWFLNEGSSINVIGHPMNGIFPYS